eukprot:CAMPEP_0114494714 /NCGR_PEP_ID=MMETSP0109-20121206/4803_1 /TAXON_ID=29199 /ORGANISM="Chlorarachnion reptans, Strain CCCM449" /LENGTH=175 /DNA_ID=CAMNT_0001671777 /DNA_START=1315 /DNA_END=1839 /DNA_ORIENTATION=-
MRSRSSVSLLLDSFWTLLALPFACILRISLPSLKQAASTLEVPESSQSHESPAVALPSRLLSVALAVAKLPSASSSSPVPPDRKSLSSRDPASIPPLSRRVPSDGYQCRSLTRQRRVGRRRRARREGGEEEGEAPKREKCAGAETATSTTASTRRVLRPPMPVLCVCGSVGHPLV